MEPQSSVQIYGSMLEMGEALVRRPCRCPWRPTGNGFSAPPKDEVNAIPAVRFRTDRRCRDERTWSQTSGIELGSSAALDGRRRDMEWTMAGTPRRLDRRLRECLALPGPWPTVGGRRRRSGTGDEHITSSVWRPPVDSLRQLWGFRTVCDSFRDGNTKSAATPIEPRRVAVKGGASPSSSCRLLELTLAR